MSGELGGGATAAAIAGGDSMSKSVVTKFFNHVLDFGDESKKEFMNLFQFAILALIPIVVLNKTVHNVVPEANVMKGSLELSMEVLGQTVVMLSGLVIIQRVITFIPTYSGEDYKLGSMLTIVLPFLMILLSLQTKLGEKSNILYKRAMDKWNGNSAFENFEEGEEDEAQGGGGGEVRRKQPIAQNYGNTPQKKSVRQETGLPGPQLPPPTMSNNHPSTTGVGPQHSAQSQQAPNPNLGPNALDGGFAALGNFSSNFSEY